MSDSSDVDAALMAKLQGDATLAALMQPGVFVFMDEAPAGSTKFVIVSLVIGTDEPMFGGTAFEDALYLVVARELSTVAVKTIKAAAARIHALLHMGTLAPIGYGFMVMRRVERVRATEVDSVDSSIRWQHRGGRYQVMVAPRAT
jgi:hypothetical protein